MNTDFARQQMVQQQLRAWDVLDSGILEVMSAVPREDFVPEAFKPLAFADTEIPLGYGQSMMTPTVEGRVLQALEITPLDTVLEVGTGSGFLTACLARLAKSVTSIEIIPDFLETARTKLERAGTDNVDLLLMDAMAELPDELFDAIAVTGSLEDFDTRFVMALKPGGRLFLVVGSAPVMEARLVIRKNEHEWTSHALFETSLTPLINARLGPKFSF